jgi:hypothetical protein
MNDLINSMGVGELVVKCVIILVVVGLIMWATNRKAN